MCDGRSAAVLRYLNAGGPVDYVTPERETPLFVAVRQGKRKFVEALLDRDANVNTRSRGDVHRSGLQRSLPETTSPNCCSIEARVWMPPMTAGALR